MTNNSSSLLHFKTHRLIEYLKFYPHYIFCKLFHEQDSPVVSWRGALICNCGYVYDLGYSYGQHCEGCYQLVCEAHRKKQSGEIFG